MVEQAVRPRVVPATGARWWAAALVTVPTALAGLAMVWPGPQLADDLRARSEGAPDAAGLADVGVTVSGRDATRRSVPAGVERDAVAVVGAVPGVRDVQVSGPPVPAADTVPPRAAVPPPAAPPAVGERLAALAGPAPITFPADSAVLAGPAAATVGQVAELLVAEPTALVVVEGHVADTPGGVDVAQQLSKRRAQVVADALVAAGVDRSRITTSGVGARQPLETPAASRRVEIRIG